MNDKRKVYVVSKGFHSFSAAEQYGELIYLSEVPIGRTQVSNILRMFIPKLANSKEDDLIVITGLSVMCALACSIFAMKHRRLNLLLFDAAKDGYVKRSVILDSIQGVEELDEITRLNT